MIGPSGCGKSTVLKVLAGLLEPMAGTIMVDDAPLQGGSRHPSYMPQSDLLLDWYDILDNVCLYGKIHGKKKEAQQQALENLKAFGSAGDQHAYPSQLSGGMRQRAAFLRTALCDSDILLLDEPFGALDVITREDMQDWLNRMRQRLDRTTLLVTHDIDEAIYLSDRILVLGQRPAVDHADRRCAPSAQGPCLAVCTGRAARRHPSGSFPMRCCDAHAHLDPRLKRLLDPDHHVMISCTSREEHAHARSLFSPSSAAHQLRRPSLECRSDQRG